MLQQEQTLVLKNSLELTQSWQNHLKRVWNKRIEDEYAFCPHDKKGLISADEAIAANRSLGDFASSNMKKLLLEDREVHKPRRFAEGKMVAGVGFGRGYDWGWFPEASIAGFQTCCIDVSDNACSMALRNLNAQMEQLPPRGIAYSDPVIINTEIRSLLAKENDVQIPIPSVEIWYFCRMLGCMSTRSAEITLNLLGEKSFSLDVNTEKVNTIMIVNALSDNNPGLIGKTSKLRSKKFIVNNLQKGAANRMEIIAEETHAYFDKIVSALTLKAV